MRVAIDTSSLVSLVKYYFHLDQGNLLFEEIQLKIEQGEIIIIDKVVDECKLVSKGFVIDSMNYLVDKEYLSEHKIIQNTDDIISPLDKNFFHKLENDFMIQIIKRQMEEKDSFAVEIEKDTWMKDADGRLILYCLDHNSNNNEDQLTIVTEESKASNDGKLIKKLPLICEYMKIDCITLPELLKTYSNVQVVTGVSQIKLF